MDAGSNPKVGAMLILAMILAVGLLWLASDIFHFGLIGMAVTLSIGLPVLLYILALGAKRFIDRPSRMSRGK